MDDTDIVEELRAVARLAAKEIDPRCVYACTTARAADEIEKLRDLLRRADKVVIWEGERHLGRGFQEEVEAALPEFKKAV